MYYVLESQDSSVIFGELLSNNASTGSDWIEGKKFSKTPLNLSVVFGKNSRTALPDYFEVADAPIVNKRFLQALERAGVKNFEAYPTTGSSKAKSELEEEYFALNVVGCVNALDAENSIYENDGDVELDSDEGMPYNAENLFGTISQMNSLSLDLKATHGFDMFRLPEYPFVIIISERVANCLKTLSGMKMSVAEGWGES
ncbi:MAG: hypothetical protein KUG82_02895 [Pseudomonadales bacterium]|nr:hypothetical protein [Pseudomonadales bacterium]